jgi:hypothetical protein
MTETVPASVTSYYLHRPVSKTTSDAQYKNVIVKNFIFLDNCHKPSEYLHKKHKKSARITRFYKSHFHLDAPSEMDPFSNLIFVTL